MINCCIIIPVYKPSPSTEEISSLKQCLNIFNNYTIIFVTHKKLNFGFYKQLCLDNNVKFSYQYFSPYYFANIYGYNSLMLSRRFYLYFKKYDYIQVYQLDSYVFSDQLKFWCSQNYDYIGAPWLKKMSQEAPPVFGSEFSLTIGNGGFSLRKTLTFINLCTIKIQLISFILFINSIFYLIESRSLKSLFYRFLRISSWLPGKIFKKLCPLTKNNEDVIWSRIISQYGKLPSLDNAVKYSFELYPEYLYELNKQKLPFGCHSWEKDCRFRFWKRFINVQSLF
jgi:hypothetical protein